MKFVSTKHACIFPMLQIGVAGIKKSIDYLEPKLYQIRSLYLYIRCPGHSLWLNKQKEKKRKLKSSLLLKELCFSVERRFFSLFLCGCSCRDNPICIFFTCLFPPWVSTVQVIKHTICHKGISLG